MATALAALTVAPSASAAPPAATGTWSDVPTSSAPEGGLEVAANGFDRTPLTISAVRAAGRVSTITLVESSSIVAPGVDPVVILACPITEPWEPTARGSLADAPAYDCSTTFDTVERVEADGAVRWVADVERFVRDGVVDVMFVTGPGRGPFSVAFEPPDDATVTVTVDDDSAGSGQPSFTPATPAASSQTATPAASPPPLVYVPPALGAPLAVPAGDAPEPVDDGDVEVALPVPTSGASPVGDLADLPEGDEGARSPIALAAVALVLGAFAWRHRVASARAESHPLAGSIAARAAAGFAGATAVVTADEEQLEGVGS